MALRNKDARIDALRSIGVFATLPKTDLTTLARHTDRVERPAGTVLCRQGQPVHQLIYLATGAAEVKRGRKVIATLGPGDVIGELSLIDGQPASATVELTDDAVLLVMSEPDFQKVMDTSFNFHVKLLKALAARLREADARLVP